MSLDKQPPLEVDLPDLGEPFPTERTVGTSALPDSNMAWMRRMGKMGVLRWMGEDGQPDPTRAEKWEELMLRATIPGGEHAELNDIKEEVWSIVDNVIAEFRALIDSYASVKTETGDNWESNQELTPFARSQRVDAMTSIRELASVIQSRNRQRIDPFDIRAAQIRVTLFRLACLAVRERNIPTIESHDRQLHLILSALSGYTPDSPEFEKLRQQINQPNQLITYRHCTQPNQMWHGEEIHFGTCYKYDVTDAEDVPPTVALKEDESIKAHHFFSVPELDSVEVSISSSENPERQLIQMVIEMLYKRNTDPSSVLPDLGKIELLVRSSKPSENDLKQYENDCQARMDLWQHLIRTAGGSGHALLPHDIRFHPIQNTNFKRHGVGLGLSATINGGAPQSVDLRMMTPHEAATHEFSMHEGLPSRRLHKLREVAMGFAGEVVPNRADVFCREPNEVEPIAALQHWSKRRRGNPRLILYTPDGEQRVVKPQSISHINTGALRERIGRILDQTHEPPQATELSNYPDLLIPVLMGFWSRPDGSSRDPDSLAKALNVLPKHWRRLRRSIRPDMQFAAEAFETLILAGCNAPDIDELQRRLGRIHGDPNEWVEVDGCSQTRRMLLDQMEAALVDTMKSISGQSHNPKFDVSNILRRMKRILRNKTSRPHSQQDFPPDGILNSNRIVDLLKYAICGDNAYERYMGMLAMEICFTQMISETARNRSHDPRINALLQEETQTWNDHILLGMFEREDTESIMEHQAYLVIKNTHGTPIKAIPLPPDYSASQMESLLSTFPFLDLFEIDYRLYKRSDESKMRVAVSSRPEKNEESLHDKILRRGIRDATPASGEKAGSTDLSGQQLIFQNPTDAIAFMEELFLRQEKADSPILMRDLDVRGFGDQSLPAQGPISKARFLQRIRDLTHRMRPMKEPRFVKFMLGRTEVMIFVSPLDYIAYHKDPRIGHKVYAQERSKEYAPVYNTPLSRRPYRKEQITTPPTPPSASPE